MPLTAKQQRFVYRKLAALRELARHVGLIAPCKALSISEAVLAERLSHYGEDIVDACLAVICDRTAQPYRRAAAGILLECFIPNWREVAGPRVVGMVVEREDSEVRAWRAAVLARDSHLCTECGSGCDLEAHHLVRWADAPELRIVVENGVTLCKRCHVAAHAQGA